MKGKQASYKHSLIFILFLIFGCGLIPQQIFAQYDSLYFDGRYRTFLTHLPPDYGQQDSAYSLILALHGGFGDAYNMEKMSGLSQKADTATNKFIIVYPEGVRNSIGKRTWNAGGCCGFAQDHNIDDVGFISLLIDTLIERYQINKNKVYATGMSNGGMLCYRLAAELSHKVAAIAPVACSMVLKETWNPDRPVPIIHFHSYLDESIPYYGGVGNGVSKHHNPPIDSVLTVWSALNGCVLLSDTLYHEPGEYLLRDWDGCENKANIQCYVTYDGGHSWPGGRKGRLFADPPSRKINASDLMWEFFQLHSLPNTTSVVLAEKRSHKNFSLYQNYPNPFNPETTIEFGLPKPGNVELTIYDINGNLVRRLVSEEKRAGNHWVKWDGRDENQNQVSSGVYLYQLKVGDSVIDFRQTNKMILMK